MAVLSFSLTLLYRLSYLATPGMARDGSDRIRHYVRHVLEFLHALDQPRRSHQQDATGVRYPPETRRQQRRARSVKIHGQDFVLPVLK